MAKKPTITVREFIRNAWFPVTVFEVLTIIPAVVLYLTLGPMGLRNMPLFYFVAGAAVGFLTPRAPYDQSGENTLVAMVLAWTVYQGLGQTLFPPEFYPGLLMKHVMIANIINGFAIILGGLLGSHLSRGKLQG